MEEKETQNVKSVEKALKILLLFSEQNRQLSTTEIARQLKLPAPTASRIIKTLVDYGFMTKNIETGKYTLGSSLYYLGELVGGNRTLQDVAEPILDKMVEQIQETAHIWVRDGIYRYCFIQKECSQPIRQVSNIGDRSPLWEGATGRVLLGMQRSEVLTSLLMEIKEEDPTVDLDNLLIRAMKAKELGYAHKTGKGENHVGCIAAPIYNENGVVEACLGISMPEYRYPEDDSEWIKLVCNSAMEISEKLGYRH